VPGTAFPGLIPAICYKAVVTDPSDFRPLTALEPALELLREVDAPELTALALEAHRFEDVPDQALEDPAAITALLVL
jgi:hypothetical protein